MDRPAVAVPRVAPVEVSPKITTDELEALARGSEAVIRPVGDREIVNVIVRAPRLVNIATRG